MKLQNPSKMLMSHRRNDDSTLNIMVMLFDKCFEDRVQSQLLVIAHRRRKNSKECNASIDARIFFLFSNTLSMLFSNMLLFLLLFWKSS